MKPAAWARHGSLIICAIAIVIAIGCALDYSSTDAHDWWDTDGDGISNAVETEPANGRYHFDTTVVDYDPSVANGLPDNGTLTSGLNYPEVDDGTYQYRPNAPYDPRYDQPDSNDWGTNALIRVIEFVGRERDFHLSATPPCDSTSLANSHFPARRFAVGDMSKLGGGEWVHSYNSYDRHGSHQNGLDVDIRFLHWSGNEAALNLRSSDSTDYDLDATMDLMQCFVSSGHVDLIFADSTVLGFWNEPGRNLRLVHDSTHYTHFHVRIVRP